MVGRTRHNLHQSFGTGKRYGTRVERRLLIALRSQQSPVPTYVAGVGHEVLVVVRYHATLGIEHRRENSATHLANGKQVVLLLLHRGYQSGVIPSLQLLGQITLGCIGIQVSWCGPCHDVHLAISLSLKQFQTVAIHLYTQSHAKRIGKTLTD